MTATVALTFDDGPSAWTPQLLDVLAEHDARATFFVLGCNIAGHEATVKRAHDDGHEFGIHGWDHKPPDDLTAGAFQAQIEVAALAVENITGVEPRWWRPPWNRANTETAAVIERLGLRWVRPTLDGYDVTRSEEQIVSHVVRELKAGAIIGLHDGIASNGQQQVMHRENTVRATARILEHCRSVTVSELLA